MGVEYRAGCPEEEVPLEVAEGGGVLRALRLAAA